MTRLEKNNPRWFLIILVILVIFSNLMDKSVSATTVIGTVTILPIPPMTVNPTSGSGGEKVTVMGLNFLPNQIINLIFTDANGNSFHLGQVMADRDGAFIKIIKVPYDAHPGSATISAKLIDVTVSSTKFMVLFPIITLNPISGDGGTRVTITGSGFAIDQKVSLFIGHGTYRNLTPLDIVDTNSDGSFTTKINIPSNFSVGDYIISARENINHDIYSAAVFSILPSDTTTILSSSRNPSILGQSVTFTAKILSDVLNDKEDDSDYNAVTPTIGTVTFTIDGVTQPSVALSGGKAILTSSLLSLGTHIIMAKYSGDANFAQSSSSPFIQKIIQTNTPDK